ncbi:MAG: ATP-binding cassette domain-containing protein [Armatimonadetes bacterium]|nr:ATP-binding cassette domain-containing protein [Armatimonadota bacterium]MDW8121113.1 ATP-binding cassette domain-containing protein [Armatimonadota bacterium]
MHDPLVELNDIYCRLGTKEVFTGLSLRVNRGEILSVVGVSGVGKSTLLKVISRLVPVQQGIVRVFGLDLSTLAEDECNQRVRSRIGFVFQSGALFDWMTVEDNVIFPLIYGVRSDATGLTKARERARQLLRVVKMEGTEHHQPDQHSGGMKKRVAIARALITQPDLILYDEPTSGLDPVMGAIIDDLIVQMRDQFGVTEIVVTHDLAAARRFSDRIAMLHNGRIIAVADPENFLRLKDPVVQQFVRGEGYGPLTANL